MITATAHCSSASRTPTQETVVFRHVPPPPPAPPVAGKPAAAPPPKVTQFQGSITIFDPAQMGQYVPGQTYTIDIGK